MFNFRICFDRFQKLQWIKQLNDPLEVVDPEIDNIIELEKARQWKVERSLFISIVLLFFTFFFILNLFWKNLTENKALI